MFEVQPIILQEDETTLATSCFYINEQGWCAQVRQLPSPNYTARTEDVVVDLLVIHNISLPAGVFGLHHIHDLFLNQLDYSAHPSFVSLKGVEVSSHFLIDRAGQVTQFVATTARAWHAGVSEFQGRSACNAFSIGIELEGSDDCDFTQAQYQSLIQLTRAIQYRHPIAHIVGHSEIAPGRKTDPGPYFDWAYYQQLLAVLG